ncbi:MAG: hypothetical protein ACE1S7_05625 [Candidatus Tisiphia sp.]
MLKNKNYNNREKNKGSNVALKSHGQDDVFQMFEDVILEKGLEIWKMRYYRPMQ